MTPDLIERFVAIVGINNAITDPDILSSYLIEQRGLYHGKTPLVLRPQSTQEVSEIMQLANETKTAIVPQGGNTGLVGAQQPDTSGNQIIISLARLNKIRSIDVQGNLILAEAGVILKNVQDAANEANRLFPLSLGSEGSCQIGGNLSSNAGGTAVLSYGNSRELCLGLEVVLPDGRILDDLRQVKKDNSGYDLKDLFIGAEGTLGIITAAVLKLYPKPRGKAVAYVGVKSPFEALQLFTIAHDKAGTMLTGFELMPRIGLEFTVDYNAKSRDPFSAPYPWYVLIDISSPHSDAEARQFIEDILSETLEKNIILDAVIASNKTQENEFWTMREEMSPAQKKQGGSIKHDISVPVAAIPDFIAEAGELVETLIPSARIVCFGHMGDGNLHYNITQPINMDRQEFLNKWADVNHHVHTLVMRYGGAFSAEHGIGQLKREELVAFKSPVAIDLMRKIKLAFDPNSIMNPRKML
ncbi:FAD-binding oxidoreductase [Bartonella sp. HY329]|uniref:FAD-binding oxidoreductase n=1 Tax=unclassified Bartonella TaxID=2645622 RepID=UPI0021C959C0|nr:MULTISPECIES: FAD-binding oxidoreductase [unclassified Bartonella]UXM96247.1 FAD-binding oxidoreductase [Bartonella sp. HY329]UXN10571.1 FAD-binding oxidoreductase [Bartonella sp. HY328]